MKPRVSIIVPVYNTERYLHRCIDSILSQTFLDFELLLIDDGSRDCSGKICDFYSQNDSRIKVFHKRNNGVSSARNFGIKQSSGDYITFIDSDDYVSSDYLDKLIDCRKHCQLSVSGCYLVSDGVDTDCQFGIPGVYNLNEFVSTLDSNLDIAPFRSPWAKLFMSEIIKSNKIFFDEDMTIGEDTCFFFSYLLLCNNISISNSCTYYWRVPENDISKYSLSFKKFIYHYSEMVSSISLLEVKTSLIMYKARSKYYDYYHELFFEYIRTTKSLPAFLVNRLLYVRQFGKCQSINLAGNNKSSEQEWMSILNSPYNYLLIKIKRNLIPRAWRYR